MAGVARIPRRRGGLCGLLLILLGAWGGLGPFVGPYFTFAYTPDKTWFYSSGRLYLSILPGAAAVLGGLLIAVTRSRTVGTLGGLLAALGGAWLIVGAPVVELVVKSASITPGTPLPHAAGHGISAPEWLFLEQAGLFVGVGILILFVASIAVGRFSMLSHKDVPDEDDYDEYPDSGTTAAATAAQYPVSSPSAGYPTASQFPASQRPFPGDESTGSQDRIPSTTGQFPTVSSPSPFSNPSSQFPPSSPSGQYPESTP
jgi:hypothetical protein